MVYADLRIRPLIYLLLFSIEMGLLDNTETNLFQIHRNLCSLIIVLNELEHIKHKVLQLMGV